MRVAAAGRRGLKMAANLSGATYMMASDSVVAATIHGSMNGGGQPMLKLKTCSMCGEAKPSSHFPFRKCAGRRYRRPQCGQCLNRNRASWKPWKRPWLSRVTANLNRKLPLSERITREEVARLGAPEMCYLCGQPIEANAELDHIIPTT